MQRNPTAWTPDPIGPGTTAERHQPEREGRISKAVHVAADSLYEGAARGVDVDIRAKACEARRSLQERYGYDVPRRTLARKIRSQLYEWASHGR